MTRLLLIFVLLNFISCSKDNTINPDLEIENKLYFPPLTSNTWETTTPESLKWNTTNISDLYSFLSQNNTRAFIVLKDGKIVLENYWGNTILTTSSFDKNSKWYWASAGKTITSFLVGLAQEEGLLNINNKTADYLGKNWSNLTLEKENLITVKHQLTMTTGLDYTVDDVYCTDPNCLQYKSDAGTQWFYHNAPYTLLEQVVTNASKTNYNQFTNNKLGKHIGMNGTWIQSGYNNVYWSTAREAARFGLLILNKGTWENQQLMQDENYFNAMVNTSQNLNPSYGYLWWLNGKNKIVYPGLTTSFNTSLAPDAPADLFAAMGKNGQFIDIVPSENLVVIRFGEAPDDSLVPVEFHNQLWKKLQTVLN